MQGRKCNSKDSLIAEFDTESRETIWKMALVLANELREKPVDRIQIENDGYACVTDEVTDISSIYNLLTLALAKQWPALWIQLIF